MNTVIAYCAQEKVILIIHLTSWKIINIGIEAFFFFNLAIYCFFCFEPKILMLKYFSFGD